MNKFYLSFFLLFSCCAYSASPVLATTTVSKLELQDNLVIFTTVQPKVANELSCIANDKSALWAFSLKTDHDREMYALLLTALTATLKVNITSANDCSETKNHERVLSVTVVK
ncbi:MAG: hypothetical protein ACI9LM_004388 [Alteromonadaceae bacterium]